MTPPVLVACQALAKAYGARVLFHDLSLGLFEGDHACLVGPNGSGKSTLLKILAGLEEPDRGTCARRGGVRVGYVAQDPGFPDAATVEDVLTGALADVDEDARPGRLAQALGRAGFADGVAVVDTLSGGFKKRLAIAQALATDPDILLMDEPTNHLDVDGILWLERVLQEQARAFLVVSHDRYFLEHVARRVLELNAVHPGGVFAVDGTYSDFLVRRDEALRGQAAYEDALANTVRREIAWLRRGAKARSTKAKGRIRQAGRLMSELDDLRARRAGGTAGIELTSSQRRTRRLLVARGLTKSFGARPLLRDIDLTLTPGTRVGLLGPNGSGKTTLLNLLAGTLTPDAGEIERAEGLRLVRFEQERVLLDPAESLRRALAPEGDAVTFGGQSVHVASWAKRFLFRPEQLELPVGRLSGGEQARILIARLVREPADVLIVDEPTNDLDIPTLEVLEDSLAGFDGALVLVTHDRFMLERVSTMVLALDGSGTAETFADYAQWEAAREAAPRTEPDDATPRRARVTASADAAEATRPKRLGYLEQRELDGMEQAIEAAEASLDDARRAAEDPGIASDAAALQQRYEALQAAQAEVDRLYARWAELDAKRA